MKIHWQMKTLQHWCTSYVPISPYFMLQSPFTIIDRHTYINHQQTQTFMVHNAGQWTLQMDRWRDGTDSVTSSAGTGGNKNQNHAYCNSSLAVQPGLELFMDTPCSHLHGVHYSFFRKIKVRLVSLWKVSFISVRYFYLSVFFSFFFVTKSINISYNEELQ